MAFLGRRSRNQWVMTSVVALLLVPVLMAAIAPVLAPIPSPAAAWTSPPLPERDEPLPDFQHLLEPLPLIVRDLPDAASRNVIAIYDTTTFTDDESASRMLAEAGLAIQVPARLDTAWRSWLHDWQGDAVPGSVMEYLATDPRNAGRLSNLAVAMHSVWVTTAGPNIVGSARLQSLILLESTLRSFPESREAIMNYMYIRSVGWNGGPIEDRGAIFNAWLTSNPDDATALYLAVNLYLNNSIWDYEQDVDALRTLAVGMAASDDPARAALGHAILGDLELGNLELDENAAYSRLEVAPFTVMHSARLALEHYDQALLLSDDPSIYTARALALEMLGDIPSAIDAQQRAVDLDPRSITSRLLLADLVLQRRGSVEEVRESIETARAIEREAISITLDQPTPTLGDIRVLDGTGELAGLASNRPERFYIYYVPPMAGAGFAVAFDEIPLYTRQPASRSGMNPVARAASNAILKSEALGDPDGAVDDAGRWQTLNRDPRFTWTSYSTSFEPSRAIALLVAGDGDLASMELEFRDVLSAATWLGFAGSNQEAIDLCEAAQDRGAPEDYVDSLQECIARNAYLLGDHERSQEAFESIGDDFMVGYVAERRGDLDEAARRYRLVAESEAHTRYIAMLRLATVLLEKGDFEEAIRLYDEFLAWPSDNDFGCVFDACTAVGHVRPMAQNNRGIAKLRLHADRDGRIDCQGDARDACAAALVDFDTALASDPRNPLFLMNEAWVVRLLGDRDLSIQLMTQARESDPTLYPVLNDLGVFATESGDTDAARRFFLDAVAANPRYDLALWNLGVLHMRDGVGGLLRGQAYLARAIVQNPSMVTESLGFLTDERIYRVEINEQLRPGAGWSFGVASSVATSIFGVVTVVVVLFQATYLVVRDKLLEVLNSRAETQSAWLRTLAAGKLPFTVDARWERWLVLVAPLAVLVFTTTWIARHGEPQAATASAALALFAVMLAVVVHEVGHAAVAWNMRATIQPAQWAPGTVLALVLAPFSISSGPFPGQKIVAQDEAAAKWVAIAGPMANLAVAVLAYLLFTVQPLPVLRMIAQVQLAAMGYALLPFAPLDGAEIERWYPRLLALLGGTAVLLGVLFSVGIL